MPLAALYLAVQGCLPSVWAQEGGTLAETVVTATRTYVKQSEVIADVKVIAQDTIEQAVGMSLAEILRLHAGIQIASNGGVGKQASLFVRGTESRHVLLLIDGVRYGSATLGTPNWDNLPLAAIERIEVLRGPAASLYGSDAMGGVVQIFTRRGEAAQPVRPYVSATLGSYGRTEAGAGVSGGVDGLTYSLGVSSLRERGFSSTNAKEALNNHNPDRDGFEQRSLFASVRYQLTPSVELGANTLVSSGDNQIDSRLNGSANFDVHGLTTTRVSGIDVAKTWHGGGKTSLKLSRADDLTRTLYRTAARVFDTRREQWVLQHDEPSALGTVTAGLEQSQEAVSSTTSYAVRERDIDAFFAGIQGAAGAHRWQVNVRRDDNSQFGGATTGSLGYGHQLHPDWLLSGALGTSFKAPTFNQLYFPGFGNTALRPEKGRSREVSLKYGAGTNTVRLTYFEQDVRDFITSSTSTATNTDRVSIDGWSLEGAFVAGEWKLSADLELLDARNQTPGASFGRKLRRRADEQLTLSIERAVHGWWVGVHTVLASDRFEDEENSLRLPGYGTVSLSAEYQINPEWTWQLRLDNLGDKRYETAYGFNQPGRMVYMTLSWRSGR